MNRRPRGSRRKGISWLKLRLLSTKMNLCRSKLKKCWAPSPRLRKMQSLSFSKSRLRKQPRRKEKGRRKRLKKRRKLKGLVRCLMLTNTSSIVLLLSIEKVLESNGIIQMYLRKGVNLTYRWGFGVLGFWGH